MVRSHILQTVLVNISLVAQSSHDVLWGWRRFAAISQSPVIVEAQEMKS
jgi:hypothetical protein